MAVPLKETESRPGSGAHELESLETDLFLEALLRRYGYDFRQYARPSIRRRVRAAVRREKVPTISALQDRMLHDPSCADRVVTALTVHTTSMFRDPGFYLAFRTKVVPLLRTYPFVRIWHAGCSTGEEVYSLAILLHEEGVHERCRIYATDVGTAHLERARRGIYPLEVMRGNTERYLQSGGAADFSRYYTADERSAVFRRDLVHNVVFSQHDLVTDGSFNDFHVILCRNVLIYFNGALRERVLSLFGESLVRFGILALGNRESLRFTGSDGRFGELCEGQRIYRRTD